MTRALLLAVLFLVSITPLSFAMEKGEYQPPSLAGFKYDKEWKTDVDKDGVKETLVTMYKNTADGKIAKLTSGNGTVWSWAVRSADWPRDRDDLTKNYTVRDSNCDGVFDEKLRNDEDYDIPDCLKDKGKQ